MGHSQRIALEAWLNYFHCGGSKYFHHGDCVGADTQAHFIAVNLGYKIIVHPPINNRARSYCEVGKGEIREKKPYIDRNHDIVDETQMLIGCSGSQHEVLRSGTWATIRYGRKIGNRVLILYPDGSWKGE
jgi:hypothetical protein